MLLASGMCRVVVVTELQLETPVALVQFSENPFSLNSYLAFINFYILCEEVCGRAWLSTYKYVCTYVCVRSINWMSYSVKCVLGGEIGASKC